MTDYKNAKICPNQVTFKNETPEEILVLNGLVHAWNEMMDKLDLIQEKEEKEPITVRLPASLVNRMKNASYFTRISLQDICERGVECVVKIMEKNNAGKFEQRGSESREKED